MYIVYTLKTIEEVVFFISVLLKLVYLHLKYFAFITYSSLLFYRPIEQVVNVSFNIFQWYNPEYLQND